ncbi:MAG: aldo/keto reductase [Bryobacterales bacterium]|nr:aldo/keto reductase [Bryobacterales bacterium]
MAELGFGTATLGRETDEEESFWLLDAAYEMGIRHFDTAEAYGGGNARAYRKSALGVDDVREATGVMHSSEILLGRWQRQRGVRHGITLATKVSSGYRAAQVETALARSLERLQTDTADVYYLHSIPKDVPLDEPLGALDAACARGRIGALGVSNATGGQLAHAARAAARLRYCQNAYNLVQCGQARDALAYSVANGIEFVAYSPLAAGFLTGKYGLRGERRIPRTRFDVIPAHEDIYCQDEGFQALARLEAVSERTGVPKHILALSWVLRQPGIGLVLVGATRREHLDNAALAAALELNEETAGQLSPAGEARA